MSAKTKSKLTTREVVINKCFGGFSLSPLAVKRLAELRGEPCYFFEQRIIDGKLRAIPVEFPASDVFMWSAYKVPSPPSQDGWQEMTMEERQESNRLYDEICHEQRPEKRDDPLLIQVIKELKKEANGSHADLKIVKIPSDVEWVVSEYDGLESIEEVHRSWG